MRRIAVLAALALLFARALRAEESKAVIGITEPIRNVTLKAGAKKTPPWSGRISRVLVNEGQLVEPGQILVEMEKSAEEIEVELRRLVAENREELRGALDKERILKSLWQNNKNIHDKNGSVALEEVQKRELEYRVAVTERARCELLEKRAKLELRVAVDGLDQRTLRSPVRGTVVKVFLRDGESCEPNEPLIQVADTSRGVFLCSADQKVGFSLKTGQLVDLKIQAGSAQQSRNGKITFVSPVVDSASGLMAVKAEFDNADGLVRPGAPGVMVVPVVGR